MVGWLAGCLPACLAGLAGWLAGSGLAGWGLICIKNGWVETNFRWLGKVDIFSDVLMRYHS